MDKKQRPAHDQTRPSLSLDMIRPPKQRTLIVIMITATLSIFLLLQTGVIVSPMALLWPKNAVSKQTPLLGQEAVSLISRNVTRVPLEAHIMSKCPDARDCLRDFVVPAMETVADLVDFRLSFIGEIGDDDSVQCMHGQTECLGNIMSLCANSLYPNNTKISLGFSTCMIMSYQHIPSRSLVEDCALEHGVDFDKLNNCISDEGKGLDLLEASFKRSKAAGVKYSCTVRLDDKFRCIRDGGQWKECQGGSEVKDLVADIKKLYKSKNPQE